MLSLLTNASATSALRLLGSTQASLAQTQARISSGLRVGGASDNAAYWSIGIKMRSQIGTLSAVDAGIDLNASIAAVTGTAVTAILAVMQGMRDDLVTAAEPGVDAKVIQDDIAARQQQIIGIADSASFNGQNWLVQNKRADIAIVETHQLDDTFAHIVHQGLANIDYRDELNPPHLDPSKPFPTGYGFTDAVTYAAKIVETDSAGTRKEEAVAYAGIDQDQDYTQQLWSRSFDGLSYDRSQLEVRARNAYSSVDASNATVTGNVDYRDAEAARIPMTVASDGTLSLATVDSTQFGLFTHYTGSTSVTETTTDAPTVANPQGTTIAGSFVYGDRSHTTSAPYESFDVDNGFEENGGALDADIYGRNRNALRQYDPENDLYSTAKTTVLNFDIDGDDPLHAVDVATMTTVVTKAMASLRDMASTLGGLGNRLQAQKSSDAALSDAIAAGLGSLLDADMNVESTRLQALQTQQQLAVQSLSIANGDGNIILKLFQ